MEVGVVEGQGGMFLSYTQAARPRGPHPRSNPSRTPEGESPENVRNQAKRIHTFEECQRSDSTMQLS